MLMDAQTSGPIAEEDEESVSNLALRLADGTNVQLSLSFFNDNQPALAGASMGGGGRRATFAPFNTYVYEPRSYTIHKSESKLPLIMLSLIHICTQVGSDPHSAWMHTRRADASSSCRARLYHSFQAIHRAFCWYFAGRTGLAIFGLEYGSR